MGAHWHCPESARLVPMRSFINLNLSRCVRCHFKLNPFSVNGSSCRLRPSRRSINYSTTNRAVDLLERHIYALSAAALPTGAHLASMDVRLVRRDLTPAEPETSLVTEHLLRELRLSRGFMLHLYLRNCDAQCGSRGYRTLRVGQRRACRAPAPPRVTPIAFPVSDARR